MSMLCAQVGLATLALAAAAAVAQPAGGVCIDPGADAGRFETRGLEFRDKRTGLTWFRCPALHLSVGANGKCDPSLTMPSQSWMLAMALPGLGPRRLEGWRLPTAEELEGMIAHNCNHQFRADLIELPPVPLWTSTESADKAVQIDHTGKRITVPKEGPYGWMIYVRR